MLSWQILHSRAGLTSSSSIAPLVTTRKRVARKQVAMLAGVVAASMHTYNRNKRYGTVYLNTSVSRIIS